MIRTHRANGEPWGDDEVSHRLERTTLPDGKVVSTVELRIPPIDVVGRSLFESMVFDDDTDDRESLDQRR